MTSAEFCAIVDVGYLPRFLVMQRSLVERTPDALLHVLCMDAETGPALERLAPGVVPFSLEELESYRPELLDSKGDRTLAEYCWTVKPVLIEYILERRPHVDCVAYLDGDLVFYSDVGRLFDDDGPWTALIVPHRSPPEHQWEQTHGVYNAGFVAFRRGAAADALLARWSRQCLEWCYARVEPGRFSDQKYLDEWPERDPGVRVLTSPGVGFAPWNAPQHTVRLADGEIHVDGDRLVFFHFQSMRLYRGFTLPRRLGLGRRQFQLVHAPQPVVWAVDRSYSIPDAVRELVYDPYVLALVRAMDDVRAIGLPVDASLVELGTGDIMRDTARELVLRARRRTPGNVGAADRPVEPT